MSEQDVGEAKYRYLIFYPSGMQFQIEGKLETVRMEGDLYPVMLLASDEIMILDPRAVVANLAARSIDYSPRYHRPEAFSRTFQSWLSEWPSWGMPGCLPVERGEQGG